jgi:holdfast attachment protein HfaA
MHAPTSANASAWRTRPVRPLAGMCLLLLMAASGASAQEASSWSEFNRPIGMGPGEMNRPIDPSTRDANGNRLIVDGKFVYEESSSSSSMFKKTSGGVGCCSGGSGGSGSSTAIGNVLNVITQGNYNTVIVNSKQINHGDQSATVIIKGPKD